MDKNDNHEFGDHIKGAAILAFIISLFAGLNYGIFTFIAIAVILTINYFRPPNTSSSKPSAPSIPIQQINYDGIFEWPSEGEYLFQIVGESHYQANIASLLGSETAKRANKICKALLIPEDNNQHDDKAIRVDIDGMTVGYMDKETARSFRRRLGAKKLTGQTTSCQAEIKGGYTMRDGSIASYGVALDLKEFNW